MKLFNGIIGVLSIFGALYCIYWEGTSFLNYGWIVTLVVLLWGICASITCAIDRKENRKKDANLAATSVIGMIFGIISCVVSIMALFNVSIQGQFLLIVFLIFVIFMLLSGIKNLVYSVKTKQSENPKGWFISLFIGILLLLVGICGVVSWLALDVLNGTTMGIMLIFFGCALLISIFRDDKVGRYEEM